MFAIIAVLGQENGRGLIFLPDGAEKVVLIAPSSKLSPNWLDVIQASVTATCNIDKFL